MKSCIIATGALFKRGVGPVWGTGMQHVTRESLKLGSSAR